MNLDKQNAGVRETTSNGFTLVELMIVVAIIGILAAIAYPSYRQYVIKSNRSAAESFMLSAANKEEQILLDLRCYVSVANNAAFPGAPPAGISLSVPDKVAGNYSAAIVASCPANATPTYTITANPTGNQLAGDSNCTSLTLDQTGAKGSSPGSVSTCW